MKKIGIILFLCVSVCNYIFASAAHPGPYLRVQPNGDSIYVYWLADEYSGYYTDLKKNVVDKNEEGYWVYVTIKKGKWFLTNQTVSKTSTPTKIDKEAVRDYIMEGRKRAMQRKRGLPEFTLKNEKIKKWINSEIECCATSTPINNLDWLAPKANFGKFDFSCLLLYRNDYTGEYYIVNHYIDFAIHLTTTDDIVSIIDVYKCDGQHVVGGGVLNKNSDFYEQIKFLKNKKLEKRVNEIDRLFEKKYKQTDKLIKLFGKKYNRSRYYLPYENSEEFFKTYTLVDVIGYSYIKYPINVRNKMK